MSVVHSCEEDEIPDLGRKRCDIEDFGIEPEASNYEAVQSIRTSMMGHLEMVEDQTLIFISENVLETSKHMLSKNLSDSICLIGIIHGIVSARSRSCGIRVVLHLPNSPDLFASAKLLLGALVYLEEEAQNQELEWLTKSTLEHVDLQ
jgi:hypothetical protein